MRTHWSKEDGDCKETDEREMAGVLARMCEGSPEDFDRFYNHYAPFVWRLARRLLDDPMEAEDLCHDVFLEALRRGHRYEAAKGSVQAWLAVMTRSRGLDRLRRRGRWTVTDKAEEALERLAPVAATVSPEERALGALERRVVREAIQELPALQRRAVLSAYYGDKSQREMAEAWQVPLGTVKSWVRYGLGNLRKGLARRGWIEPETREGERR